jgi:hypothetical protein
MRNNKKEKIKVKKGNSGNKNGKGFVKVKYNKVMITRDWARTRTILGIGMRMRMRMGTRTRLGTRMKMLKEENVKWGREGLMR